MSYMGDTKKQNIEANSFHVIGNKSNLLNSITY